MYELSERQGAKIIRECGFEFNIGVGELRLPGLLSFHKDSIQKETMVSSDTDA